jgi:CRP-like cAMP-binding protein
VRHAGYREPRLLRLVNGSLSQRTAALLIQEARGSVVTLPQSTLAAMLGASRPSVNRVLRDFERAQVISLHYRKIRIVNAAELHAIAHGNR